MANLIKLNSKLMCASCGDEKPERDYYKSYNLVHKTGKIPYCKLCLKRMICNKEGSVSLDRLKETMQLIDRPFLYDLWKSANVTGGDVFGIYMKNVQMQQYKKYRWEDSIFTSRENPKINYDTFYESSVNFEITQQIVAKWGSGYKLEEYEAFERKYELLKNNYPEKTSMHTEALLKYIRYSVKEEMATAGNEVADAKSWGALAKDAAVAAKITPNLLSKSDLQDGLTTFGQLTRVVEQAVDIIPILTRFKKKPQDDVDFTLWCYVNYIRNLKGLPDCEYEEIYRFYDDKKKEYAEKVRDINEKSLNRKKEEELRTVDESSEEEW